MTKRVCITKEDCDVYCGRPSKWGNPYSHKDNTLAIYKTKSRRESLQLYKEYILSNSDLLDSLYELKGKKLGCWCKQKTCHVDILVELVNNLDKKSIF